MGERDEEMKLIFNTSGGGLEYDGHADQPLRALKLEAMERFNLDASQADRYLLACNGDRLDEARTLTELGLPEDSVIILWRMGGPARTSPLNTHREASSLYTRF